MSRSLLFLFFLFFLGVFSVDAELAPSRVMTSNLNYPNPGGLYSYAMTVVEEIDRGQAGQVWDGASYETRRTVKRAEFVENTGKIRGSLGNPGKREWILIVRRRVGQLGSPGERCISVEFLSLFSGGRKVQELVSFRQDEAGGWKFSDYSLRVVAN